MRFQENSVFRPRMSDLSRRSILQLAIAPAFMARARAQLQDLPPTVSRIYPGVDGRLVYVPDEQGNTLIDSSHAGYGGGGVPIPTAPVKETIWPVAGDNTPNVQAAIDKVSALPLDASSGNILWMVMRDGIAVAGIGAALGLIGGLLAARSLSALLFGTSPADPATLGAAAGILLGVALLAGYIPARRATRLTPRESLIPNP